MSGNKADLGAQPPCHTFLSAPLGEWVGQWGAGYKKDAIKVDEILKCLNRQEPLPFSSGAPNQQLMGGKG